MYYYIIGEGQIIESLESPPTSDYLASLAEDCELDELWVIRGEHSGITYERPKSPALTRPIFRWNDEKDYRRPNRRTVP